MQIDVKIEGLDRIGRGSDAAKKSIADELDKAFFAIAKRVEGGGKKSITEGDKSGRVYRRGKNAVHRASAPGEAPANDTGRLLNSINGTAQKGALEAIIKAGSGIVRYARMLEFGTSKMAARPFMFPAVEKNRSWIAERLNKAVRDGVVKVVRR